jgi:predicted nucleotidyltransferase
VSTLSPEQVEALRTLRAAFPEARIAFPEARIALIGASALGLRMDLTWRNSADLALAIAVGVAELDATKLPGWQQHPRLEHRWKTITGVVLDLIPAPPQALASRELIWPKSGQRMNLAGIGLALDADTSRLDADLSIAVPSVALIALLKMAAYTDRPDDRVKDLKDLGHVLEGYPSLDEDRVYSPEIFDEGLDVPQSQAFILGRELREICAAEDRAIVEQFLQLTADGAGWSRFVSLSPWPNDEERLRRKIEALRMGFRS